MLVAFKLDDRVDDMFQNLRTGQCPFLVDVPYQQYRDATRFGKAEQCRRTFSYLRDAARRTVHLFGVYGLDGIDDNYFGMEVLDLCENVLQGCLAKDMDIFAVAFSYALGPHLQLVGALFATYIKDSAFGHVEDGLEGERTLADARLTSQENDGTGNHSTAQHTIEFIVIHVDAWCLFRCNVAQEARMVFSGKRGTYGTGCRPCGLASRIVAYPDFLECVPLSTRRTFAHPFRRFLSAILTDVCYLVFCHIAIDVLEGPFVPIIADTPTAKAFLL